jgi:SAM-dependent methyltransferase
VLAYHRGGRNVCVDLGCGHGVVARALADEFEQVYGVDPSAGMIAQAESLTSDKKHVAFVRSSAESLPFLQAESVDLAVSGEAAHWFNYEPLFAELKRVVKPGGTIAFWGYADHVYVGYPRASAVLRHYASAKDTALLGPYWPQPGHRILQDKLRALRPPPEDWTDIQRLEYEPAVLGAGSGQGTKLMDRRVTLGESLQYIRTWSAYHGWREAHPDPKMRSEDGDGDVVDELCDKMLAAEKDWQESASPLDREVEIEWASVIILARKI